MKNNRVLDFQTYHKLNEADETTEQSTPSMSAVDQIVNLFFQSYNAMVTKIGGYKDAAKDLTDVAESDDKGKSMLDTLTKVAGKMDPKFKDAGNEMLLAAKKLKEAYDALITTDEGKKSLESINKKIYKKIIDGLTAIKDAAAQAPKVEAKNESFDFNIEEQGHLNEGLFGRNLKEEKDDLIKKITPIYAQVVNLGKNSPDEALKAECIKIAKELKGYYDLLDPKNEKNWEDMKRKERKEKIDEIAAAINGIPERMNNIQSKTLVKMGIDKKVEGAIKSAMDSINSATEILNKKEEQEVEKAAEKDKEETEEKKDEKKDEKKKGDNKEYNEIETGNKDSKNLQKKGKNFEAIKGIQDKLNKLLPEGSKIKADGLYGKGTEGAIAKVASMFSDMVPALKGLDGKTMTKDLQRFLDKYEANKGKIADLFK